LRKPGVSFITAPRFHNPAKSWTPPRLRALQATGSGGG